MCDLGLHQDTGGNGCQAAAENTGNDSVFFEFLGGSHRTRKIDTFYTVIEDRESDVLLSQDRICRYRSDDQYGQDQTRGYFAWVPPNRASNTNNTPNGIPIANNIWIIAVRSNGDTTASHSNSALSDAMGTNDSEH
jgi:hypothetical protein